MNVAKLIAPTEVTELLNVTLAEYMRYIWHLDRGASDEVVRNQLEELIKLRESLDKAVRADLGETD